MKTSPRRISRLWRCAPGGFAALGAWLSGPVVAAGAAGADQTGQLEEVVVTAEYREEKLQDTPVAITAITAHDIDQRSFSDSFEVGYTVPNASFRPAQAAFGNTMTAFIRGVGQYDFDFAFEPGVGVYVDDVYQPFTMGTQMDLMDMDRVEVLRGPQGTLFGRGSIGGVVRLISKKAEGTDTGYIDVTPGSYKRIDLRAGYDFKLTDNLFARVTGVSRHSDGYQNVVDFACAHPTLAGVLQVSDPSKAHHCITGTQGGISVSGLRGQLRWVVGDNFEASLAAEHQADTSEAKADTLLAIVYPKDLSGNTIPTTGYALWNAEYAQHVPTPGAPYGFGIPYDNRFIPPNSYTTYATYNDPNSGLAFKPQSGLDKTAYSGSFDWKLAGKTTLTAIFAYTDMRGQLASDADASPMNLQVTAGEQDYYWATEELRLTGRAFDRADWTLGGFFYQGNAQNHQTVSFPPIIWGVLRNAFGMSPDVAAAIINSEQGKYSVNTSNLADNGAQAGYAHVVFALSPKSHLTLGARYSHDKKDVHFDNSFFIGPINSDYHHFDWRAGLDYKIADNALIYGSASTGYRPPAYNPRPFTATQAVVVGGEEMTSYELGVKADLFNRTLRTNAAVFYSDYDKRIVPIGGTECIAGTFVPPNTPGAIQDSNGQTCLAVTSLTSYQQLKGAKIKGAELEVSWRPIAELSIDGSFGYTKWNSPEIDNCDFNQDGKPDPGVTCFNEPVYVPKYNWNVSAAYDIALPGGAKLTPRADLYGQSEICSSVVSQLSCTDGYQLLNLRLQWTGAQGRWTAALGGTNVSNKEYFLNKFDLTPFGQNTVEGQPGRPREWYLTVSHRF